MAVRVEKEAAVAELKRRFKDAKSVIFADYRGLNVAQVTKLRAKLRQAGIEYKVVKNTLARIAAREVGLTGVEQFLEGPTAVAFGIDPVAPAKAVTEFARDNEQLEIKAGVLEGRLIDLAGVKALAELPPRGVLLARVLGGMQAPLSGLATVLHAPLRQVVWTLEAVRKKQEAIIG